MANPAQIKIALLDLYADYPNQGIPAFQYLFEHYSGHGNTAIEYQVFDVRGKAEIPGLNFDIYISSGGPGSPIDSESTVWENAYFDLIDRLQAHNQQTGSRKKYAFFVCHAFQLMCRRLRLGYVNLRHTPVFDVVPVHLTGMGAKDELFGTLPSAFHALDSRSWQVIVPDEEQFKLTGAALLAMEEPHPAAAYPPAMMAVRFNPYSWGTQFHPEANPGILNAHLRSNPKRQEVITAYGEQHYCALLEKMEAPAMMPLVQRTVLPGFLDTAILSLTNL